MTDSSTQVREPAASSLNLPTPAPPADKRAPRYWIPPHVLACTTATGTVVLNLKRNRYYGIGSNETRALRTLDPYGCQTNIFATTVLEPMALKVATRMAERLVNADLLSREAPPVDDMLAPARIDLSGTLTSVGHQINRSAALRARHVIRFLRACAWARRAIHSRTLYSVACEISRQRQQPPTSFDAERAIDRVCLFQRLRPFTFAAQDQCLFHALALMKFLSYDQLFPSWVIGVRAKPWSAHSWVQEGSLLLDANPEHVCEYTPILIV